MRRIIPCVMITLALILAGSFLPVLGVAGLMLCPLPLSVLGCAEGHKRMGIAELLIEATLFLAFSPTMAVYFLIGCAPLATMIFTVSREDIKTVKNYSGAESLLICAGASVAFKVILLVLFWVFTGKNILFPDLSQMDAVFTQLYGDNPELRQAVIRVLALFPRLLPAVLVVYCGVEAYLNYSLCSSFVRRICPESKNFPPALQEFKMWRFPASLMVASVVSLVAGYFIDTDSWLEGAVFVMNLQIVLNVFMFVEGLSVAFWILSGFRFRRAGKVIVFVMVMFPFFWPWLIVMGMCDIVLNLRERISFVAK